jgi:hypothetical protein
MDPPMTGLDPNRPDDPPFVPHTFPEHDDAVVEIAHAAHSYAAKMGLMHGVGIMDFADGTVIVLSHVIPPGETQVVNRRTENHIQAGMGRDPFAGYESVPDFTDNLVEIKNPDAPKVWGVNGTRKDT